MIFIPILLVVFTGLLILWLNKQYEHLNIFEQLSLGFIIALSLFVFELFIEALLFNRLSIIGPVITFLFCIGLFFYKNFKNKILIKEVKNSIKSDFNKIGSQFKLLRKRQQYIVLGLLIYVIIKFFMMFFINTNIPTFDEDAVTGWDMKTKIFTENKSMVLDKNNPEFLGSALERNVFAPLTDTYFLLLSTGNINSLTNIISPLIYLSLILCLFGIFLRKKNLFLATIAIYLTSSIPFLFVHGIGAYFNFVGGILVFIFTYYFVNYIVQKNNIKIAYRLLIGGFLAAAIRNESFIILLLIFFLITFLQLITKSFKKRTLLYLIPLIIFIFSNFLISSYGKGFTWNIGWIFNSQEPSTENGNFNSTILEAPLVQGFYHSDYNILYLLYIISLILLFNKLYAIFSKEKTIDEDTYIVYIGIMILCASIYMLYKHPGLGLLTHFAFVRYSVFLSPFLIYTVINAIGLINLKGNDTEIIKKI